ncbi:MAG: hypothetical protein NTU93_07250 [Arthrobacter sp.]|nr:hypothetical protein [Arthrobacter sp.]
MRATTVRARTAWSGVAAASLILLCLGLSQTLYLGEVGNAYERDRTGNALILAGAALGLAAAGWSHYRGAPRWVSTLVAAPAVAVAGLNLVVGDSLLPHVSALVAVPLGLAGIIGGIVGSSSPADRSPAAF